MSYRVSYGGALIGEEEKKAIMGVVNRNWWPVATEGELMEKEASKFLGVKYGVLANSGSSAGLLALTALELPRGSEVIIPAVTFPTIFNIILQCGLIPVVVDAKVGTYNLDPKELEKAITKKTKAIICVHAVGNPVDMPAVMKIAKKHKLYVLEDNCDGWGGSIAKKRVGSFGHISFTSFHAAHIVAMGQGGGVFTNSKELARKVRMYRDWGRQSDIPKRSNGKKWPTLPEDYDSRFIYEKIGYNLGPLELQAAMGRVQLKRTKEIKALRKRNFHYLYDHLSVFPDLIMPTWVKGADPSWFAMPLSTKTDRGSLVAFLEDNGIETRSMFAGNILKHPAYKNVKYRSMLTKGSQCNFILKNSFWIGVHPRMTKKDLEYVVNVFKRYALELPDVTLIALSGINYQTKENLEAIRRSCEGITWGAVKYIQQGDIVDINSWNKAVIYDLHKYVDTEFAMFVHGDGFPINPSAWKDEFLSYDYIGAPWPLPRQGDFVSYRTPTGELIRVGNSVSLRSKRILELPSQLNLEWKSYYGNTNEDGFLCVHNRDILQRLGIRFAALEVAKFFSKEHEIPENQGIETFAFHQVDL